MEDASRHVLARAKADGCQIVMSHELADRLPGIFSEAHVSISQDSAKLARPVDDGNPDNGAGPIAPSAETVRNGTYRPLSRPIFIYVNTAALARPEVQQFVQYYLDNGSELIKEVGYVPLTDAEQKLVRQRFTNKTTGTMFDASAPMDDTSTSTALPADIASVNAGDTTCD